MENTNATAGAGGNENGMMEEIRAADSYCVITNCTAKDGCLWVI